MFSPFHSLFCSTDIQSLIYLCCQRATPELWFMEHSCKGRAASFTADYYISAQWLTGSTCTGNLEGNRHRAFCSSTCPAVSPAFVQSDKLFLSPVWTFHALLGYLEIFLSRNQLRFSLFGMFNEADISGKPQSVCMHWHSKPTVSWTHHVYHWCRLCLQLLGWGSDHPQSTFRIALICSQTMDRAEVSGWSAA